VTAPRQSRHIETRPLADCGLWLTGGTPSRSNSAYWNGTTPWISAKSLKSFRVSDSDERLTPLGVENGSRVVPEGALLFVVRGMSLANEFRVGVASRAVALNQDLRALIPASGIDSLYLAHFLRHSQRDILALVDRASHGTTRLATERLGSLPVPLPPIHQQRRIARILDKADNLRTKRQAVFAQLDELAQSVFSEMFGNPMANDRGWSVGRVADAGRVQLGRQRAPQYQSGKHTRPYVRVANVYEDRIDLADVLSMDFDDADFAAYKLESGDILLNEGQSTELVGRPAMWRNELPDCCFQNTLVRFQPENSTTVAEFALDVFLWYFRSGEFAKVSSKTSNVAHLGSGRFAAMPFPIPPIALQSRYARRTQRIRRLKNAYLSSLSGLTGLFASLQHRAFRGEL
jgi:type I restriction enzyme, S subunit